MELTAAAHNIRQLYHNDHRNLIPRIADKEKDDSRGRGQQIDGDKRKIIVSAPRYSYHKIIGCLTYKVLNH